MNYPYMPKSTALWLIENTALTFEQIAEFCGMHELEIKNIADAESHKIQGLNPILNGQLTRENIKECEANPEKKLVLLSAIVDAQKAHNKRGVGYTPKLHRQNRMGGILWILKNYPDLSDGQVARLMRSTNTTVSSIRDKTHASYANIEVCNPITLGLVSKSVLDEENIKAQKKKTK
ncbi:MAG: cell cycle transcriptional regulator TrcR [Alphaproteobacteria bacterium]